MYICCVKMRCEVTCSHMPRLLAQSRTGRNETKVQYKLDPKEATNESSGAGESSNNCVDDNDEKI